MMQMFYTRAYNNAFNLSDACRIMISTVHKNSCVIALVKQIILNVYLEIAIYFLNGIITNTRNSNMDVSEHRHRCYPQYR